MTRSMRVIHTGVMLSFGKHKGRPVEEVLKSEPGYFFWLLVNKQAVLTPEIMSVVADWVSESRNHKEAEYIARKAGYPSLAQCLESQVAGDDGAVNGSTPVPAALAKFAEKAEANPAWGSW